MQKKEAKLKVKNTICEAKIKFGNPRRFYKKPIPVPDFFSQIVANLHISWTQKGEAKSKKKKVQWTK